MKKFLFLLLFLASLTYSATEDNKKRFLNYYYNGRYADAHHLVRLAFLDPLTRDIWEERLHLQKVLPSCSHLKTSSSAKAMALLRIGRTEEAFGHMGTDWLSLAGRATLAYWKNDLASARNFLNQAMRLKPEEPSLLYVAGQFASSDQEAVGFFKKYMAHPSRDPYKQLSARYSIEFAEKTRGMDLNQTALSHPRGSIESEFEDRKLTIRAKMDQKNEVVLLVDTGASGLSLKDKDWKARNTTDLIMVGLGSRQRTKASLVIFDHFSTGDFQMKNPVAAVSSSLQGEGFDGIAGSIIFAPYTVVLPMHNDSNITLSPLTTHELLAKLKVDGHQFKTQETLPFFQVGKMIILKGRIKRSDDMMDILLDTGAQTSLVSSATAKKYVYVNYPKSFRYKRRTNLRGLGGKIDNLLHIENVEIQLGSLQKEFNRMVAINMSQVSETLDLEIDMILGQDFLKGYTLLIDYKNNLVTFLS